MDESYELKDKLFEHKFGFIKLHTITSGHYYQGRDNGIWYVQIYATGGTFCFDYETEEEARQAVDEIKGWLQKYIDGCNERRKEFEKRLAVEEELKQR